MKYICGTLVDSKTGKPLEIDIPEELVNSPLRKAAWDEGQRMRIWLTATEFFNEGASCGLVCRRHPEQVIQEKWTKEAANGNWSYDDFKSWSQGYRHTKRKNY